MSERGRGEGKREDGEIVRGWEGGRKGKRERVLKGGREGVWEKGREHVGSESVCQLLTTMTLQYDDCCHQVDKFC